MNRAPRLASLLILLAGLLAPASVSAKPQRAGAFDLSGEPQRIAKGPDGNIWVTLSGSSENNTLARIKLNGNVTEYSPAAVVNPTGIGSGPDGNLWLTRNGGVIRVDPEDPDNSQSFNITLASPQEITAGPAGKLWTASNDQLVSFDPANPAGFNSDTINGMGARGITVSEGRLWIADFGDQRIVRAKPNGDAKFYNVGGNPRQVAAGAQKTVAYTNPGTDPHTVGRIKPGEQPKTTKAPQTDATGITRAADGNWWTANPFSNDLGILEPNGKYSRFKDLPNNADARYLAAGRKGTIWVALTTQSKVVKIKGVG